MTERDELARDLWNAGSKTPYLLAEHLLKKGWTKRPRVVNMPTREPIHVNIVNQVNDPIQNQEAVRGVLRRSGLGRRA